MDKKEKDLMIADLAETLNGSNVVYLADVSELDAEKTSRLRRMCHTKQVSLRVVKNTLLRKAMDRVEGKNYEDLYGVLKGNTSIMIAEAGNAPAKLIKEFRKKDEERPLLKGAYVEEAIYIGDDQLEALVGLKSKEELIGEIISLLQSPATNVVSALQSGGNTLSGLVKALSERPE